MTTPREDAIAARRKRERDLMASNHAIGRHRGGRLVQGCPLCEVKTYDGLVQRAHVVCCWCGEHHEEGR